MIKLRRVAAVIAVLGSLLTLSACATTSISPVAGSYKATFVVGGAAGSPDTTSSLVLSQNGQFAMTPSGRHVGASGKGTWRQSKGVVTLNAPTFKLVARLKGKNLSDGRVVYVGVAPQDIHG